MKKLMLKAQYIKSERLIKRYDYLVGFSHPNRRNHIVRCFSTKQERSCTLMHEIEYAEYNFKVRVNRANQLVDSWADISSSLFEVEKCWKNNSKRRHQWIETDSLD